MTDQDEHPESHQLHNMRRYVRARFAGDPNTPRKYWNHLARHTPGQWLRYRLLSEGHFIKTSNPDEYARRPNIYEQAGILPKLLSETITHETVQ